MTAYNTELINQYGQIIRPILFNTAKDGSGTWLFPLLDSEGHLQVDVLSLIVGNSLEVRVAKAIDASIGAYGFNDVVNDDDCSTTATCWTFPGMASAVGGYGVIKSATIFSETENIEPRLTLFLFNATPTGQLTDNSANTNPLPADRIKYVGKIEFPALNARSASCASEASATPSTVGGLPLWYKCAAAATALYGVLVTEDIFTQSVTDDIEIALQIEHL